MPTFHRQATDEERSGILRGGGHRAARILFWLLILFAACLALLFAALLGAGWLGLHGKIFYVVPAIVPAAALAGYALVVRVVERRAATEVALPRGIGPGLFGIAVGTALIIAIWLVSLALGTIASRPTHMAWTGAFGDLVMSSWVSAALEELAFRAVLLRLLARLTGPLPALLVSSALFGLAHAWAAPAFALVPLMVTGGLVFGLLYMRTGSLWASIGAHLAYDFVEHSVMGLGSDGPLFVTHANPAVPVLLSGGDFGPDGSVPGLLVGAAAAILLLRLGRKRPLEAA